MEGEFSLYFSVHFITYTPVFLALQHSPHPRKRKKLDLPDEEWIPRCRSILVPSVPISPKWWPCTSSASGCLKTTLTVSHMLLFRSSRCGTGTPGDLAATQCVSPLILCSNLWSGRRPIFCSWTCFGEVYTWSVISHRGIQSREYPVWMGRGQCAGLRLQKQLCLRICHGDGQVVVGSLFWVCLWAFKQAGF